MAERWAHRRSAAPQTLTVEALRRTRQRASYHLNRLALAVWLRRDRSVPTELIGRGYGSWVVPSAVLPESAICYCVGVGEDTQLDEELMRRGHSVIALDPTPRAIAHARTVLTRFPQYRFEAVGLWSESTTMRFYGPTDPMHVSHSILNLQHTDAYFVGRVERLAEVARRLGHETIHLLKLDIEGAEHEVLRDLVHTGPLPNVLLVEFDQPVALRTIMETCRLLERSGYRAVNQDRWNTTWIREQ